MRRRLIAALLAAGLLAAPSAAIAQSAGDEQYTDPFGQSDPPAQNDGGSNGSATPDTGAAAPAPATGAEATAGSGSSTAALPHTGFPAALSAMLGALLLIAGASVWRRAQSPLALPPWLTPAGSRRARFGARRRRRR
jgi:LPXTG-motif cell wall-anchored protein